MEPYYQAWESSAHDFVPCVDCHYPPGSPRTILWKKFQALSQVAKYVTRTYSSKPFAEIEDISCLRADCHSKRLLEGRVVSGNGIKFDHAPHLLEVRRDRQLRCVSCHSQIVVGKHVEVTYDTCYLCHFRGQFGGREMDPVAGCLGCHELPDEVIRIGNMGFRHDDFVTGRGVSCSNCHLGVAVGEGRAPEDRCLLCHNQPEQLARYGDVPFLHENHVTKRNVACFHCHHEIRHGLGGADQEPLARLGEPEPGTTEPPPGLHRPTLSFDCSFCHVSKHSGQLLMYSGRPPYSGVPEMPSPMYLAKVDCIGCHYSEGQPYGERFRGFTHNASKRACVRCHGPEFNGIWEETEVELQKTLEEVLGKMERARAALEGMDDGDAGLAGKGLSRAEEWHRFVQASRGEHNIYLASLILRREDELLSRAGERAGESLPDLSELPLISGAYCATLCHERLGVEVPPDAVEVEEYGATMPHGMHSEMMGCVKCHSIGAHKEVPLHEDVFENVCGECH
jgi:hypothetical protein